MAVESTTTTISEPTHMVELADSVAVELEALMVMLAVHLVRTPPQLLASRIQAVVEVELTQKTSMLEQAALQEQKLTVHLAEDQDTTA